MIALSVSGRRRARGVCLAVRDDFTLIATTDETRRRSQNPGPDPAEITYLATR